MCYCVCDNIKYMMLIWDKFMEIIFSIYKKFSKIMFIQYISATGQTS